MNEPGVIFLAPAPEGQRSVQKGLLETAVFPFSLDWRKQLDTSPDALDSTFAENFVMLSPDP